MKSFFSIAICAFALSFACSSNAAVIYDVQNGKLASASGVNIGGELYKVSFGDSCASMYSGCNPALFSFASQQGAVGALQALFDQVFVDNVVVNGVEYDFDSNATSVKSCDLVAFCEIWVPYADVGLGLVQSAWYINQNGNDFLASATYIAEYTYGDTETYMAFTRFERVAAAADVPEPASLALLGIGLAGIAAARRRKQA